MMRITALARCLSQINKNNADLLPKNWANTYNSPYLPKKLLPQQKDPGTQNMSKNMPHSTMLFGSKTAQAPGNMPQSTEHMQQRYISLKSSGQRAYMGSGSAEAEEDILLNHEIQVMHVGEAIRVKPYEERGHAKEPPIYSLSNLDQNMTPVMMKIIHLYKSPPKGYEGSVVRELVSNSLAKVLSHYYPLAGKFGTNAEGQLVVECTDDGVMLRNAKANSVMDDVLACLDDVDTMQNFFYDVQAANILEIPPMTVQVTSFQCGGFAVAISMSHSMSDGISLVEFFKNWGQIARDLPLDTPPYLDRKIIVKDLSATPHPPGFIQLKEKTKTESVYDDQPLEYRSFVFDEEKILKLKRMATREGSGVSTCSTFDVITAFLWRARTKAFNVESNKQIKVLFSMNVRSKFDDPPLPKGYFGNATVIAHSFCTAGKLLEKEFSYGVKLIQDAKNMVDGDYARSFINCLDPAMNQQSLTTSLMISSWCNLAFNEMDFGWGKAVHAGPAVVPLRELAGYFPFGKNKKGVIVRMGLPQSVMEEFQKLLM